MIGRRLFLPQTHNFSLDLSWTRPNDRHGALGMMGLCRGNRRWHRASFGGEEKSENGSSVAMDDNGPESKLALGGEAMAKGCLSIIAVEVQCNHSTVRGRRISRRIQVHKIAAAEWCGQRMVEH